MLLFEKVMKFEGGDFFPPTTSINGALFWIDLVLE